MKISDLIKVLKHEIKENGDLDINVRIRDVYIDIKIEKEMTIDLQHKRLIR